MAKLEGRIFMTGGSGTLGRAIVNHAIQNGWNALFTIYSRDPMRQAPMRGAWYNVGGVKCQLVIGDVRDQNSLLRAMAGHDIVLHLAAMKHIPQAEADPDACYEINVTGSRHVLDAALIHGIKDVVLITTDKACAPINSYGCTKMMMERLAFAYSKAGLRVYLPRYGNVIESTGSVLVFWKKQIEEGKPISVTDPKMTRFWLTPARAAQIVVESLDYPNLVYVPKLPALSIEKVVEYSLGEPEVEIIGLRPGEKIHEELLTWEESAFAINHDDFILVRPPTSERYETFMNYSSDKAPEIERDDMRAMLGLK